MTIRRRSRFGSVLTGITYAVYWDLAMGFFMALSRGGWHFPPLPVLGTTIALWSPLAIPQGLSAYRARARQLGEAIPLTRIVLIAVVPLLLTVVFALITKSRLLLWWVLPILGVVITAGIIGVFVRDARQHDSVSDEPESVGGAP